MTQKIGPREQQLREMRERRAAPKPKRTTPPKSPVKASPKPKPVASS